MDPQLLLPSVGIFLTVIFAASGVIVLAKSYATKRVRDRLEGALVGDRGLNADAESIILGDLQMSAVPFLNEILMRAQWAQRLQRLLVQAGIPFRLGIFLGVMLVCGAVGIFAAVSFARMPILALPAGVLTGSLPLLYARYKKQKRTLTFERQFPDALEMLVSALRAGLALPGAIQVVADESPDPVGREFAILSEENRLGLDMKVALKKMGERVDSRELHLFITAVILARGTGGNLAEILERTAEVIRERFRILGDVRSLTAHARLSGFILGVLPIGMAAIIMVLSPEYLKGLVADPLGHYLIIGAIVLQILGFLIMRRIINIKV